jgi:integrase
MKINFRLNQKGNERGNKASTIQIRLYNEGKYCFISTKILCLKRKWNEAKERVIVTSEADSLVNEILDGLEKKIQLQITKDILGKKKTTFDDIKNLINNSDSNSFIHYCKAELRKEVIKDATYNNIIATLTLLEKYEQSVNQKIFLDSWSKAEIEKFDKFCQEKGIKINSRKRHHSIIRKYLNKAIDNEVVPPFYNGYHSYKIKGQSTNIEHLTALELGLIESLERCYVTDLFLLSCYTGLRFSDITNLRKNDFLELDNFLYLLVNTEKTGIKVTLNLSLLMDGKAIEIVKKYRNLGKNDLLFSSLVLTNQKINRRLKAIQAAAGIKKRLHFHIARHTFATLLLEKGLELKEIQQLLGHTDLKTTSIYAKITTEKLDTKLKFLYNIPRA